MELLQNQTVQACIKAQLELWKKTPSQTSLDAVGEFLDVANKDLEYALTAPCEELQRTAIIHSANLAGAVARARCGE